MRVPYCFIETCGLEGSLGGVSACSQNAIRNHINGVLRLLRVTNVHCFAGFCRTVGLSIDYFTVLLVIPVVLYNGRYGHNGGFKSSH